MDHSITITFSDVLIERLVTAAFPGAFSGLVISKPGVESNGLPVSTNERWKLWRRLEQEFDPVETESPQDLDVKVDSDGSNGSRPRRTKQTYRSDVKLQALQLYFMGKRDRHDIAEELGIHVATLSSWIAQIQRGEEVALHRGSESPTVNRSTFSLSPLTTP